MKLQTKFGKAEVKNGKLKQVIEKQKLKSSQLAFAARQAKIQIEELGGGIKLATLENEKDRLMKDNDKNVQNLAIFSTEKDMSYYLLCSSLL